MKNQRKIIISTLIGNILEWFDFSIYGYLSSTIAILFFPEQNFISALFLTYGIFAIGFFIRPLGAVVLGHIGDVHGRKNALLISVFAMAIPTFLIGCLPTYESIGIWSSILLLICRLLQGFSIGGEYTGSFVYLVEQAEEHKKGVNSCWADIGCVSGMILGSSMIAILNFYLTTEEFQSFGWRIPFLCGIILGILGIYIRKELSETPAFLDNKQKLQLPIKHLFKNSPLKLVAAILVITVNAATFYTILVYIPNQTILLGKFNASNIFMINAFLLIILMISNYLTAIACDYFDPFKIYLLGCLGCIMSAVPTFYALSHFTITNQLLCTIPSVIFIGMVFAPRPLVLAISFPTEVRYSSAAIALNVSNAVFGGTAPFLSAFFVNNTGIQEAPAAIIIIAGCISIAGLFTLKLTNLSSKLITS